MTLGLQNTIALLVVAAAAGYLAWRVLARRREGSSGCGSGCVKCPTAKSGEPLVELKKFGE